MVDAALIFVFVMLVESLGDIDGTVLPSRASDIDGNEALPLLNRFFKEEIKVGIKAIKEFRGDFATLEIVFDWLI